MARQGAHLQLVLCFFAAATWGSFAFQCNFPAGSFPSLSATKSKHWHFLCRPRVQVSRSACSVLPTDSKKAASATEIHTIFTPLDDIRCVLFYLLATVLFHGAGWAFAAPPDLSHSPLAKSQINFNVEGYPRIVDGDTLVFQSKSGEKEKVRLLGIDAPESKQICKNAKGAPYECGVESKAYLETIIGKDPVVCLAAKRDQYSRVLGVCFDEKTGKELNEAMVAQGEAVAYVQFSKAYVANENLAISRHKGLWQGEFQKPWDFRKMKRTKAKTAPSKTPTTDSSTGGFVLSGNPKVKMAKTEFPTPDYVEDLEEAE